MGIPFPNYFGPPTSKRVEDGAVDVNSWVVNMKDTADEDPERMLKHIEAKANRHKSRHDFKPTPPHLLEP